MNERPPVVGFFPGVWDVLHTGHVIALAQAFEMCDVLVAGLLVDPTRDRPEKIRPVQSVYERFTQLRACRYVQEIVPYESEDDLIDLLSSLPMHMRFVGEEYMRPGAIITGRDVCDKMGITIVPIRRRHKFSSTELKRRLNDMFDIHTIEIDGEQS